jgi:hypothetical protein
MDLEPVPVLALTIGDRMITPYSNKRARNHVRRGALITFSPAGRRLSCSFADFLDGEGKPWAGRATTFPILKGFPHLYPMSETFSMVPDIGGPSGLGPAYQGYCWTPRQMTIYLPVPLGTMVTVTVYLAQKPS